MLDKWDEDDFRPVGTPMDQWLLVSFVDSKEAPIDHTQYMEFLGWGTYLGNTTRPDICFAMEGPINTVSLTKQCCSRSNVVRCRFRRGYCDQKVNKWVCNVGFWKSGPLVIRTTKVSLYSYTCVPLLDPSLFMIIHSLQQYLSVVEKDHRTFSLRLADESSANWRLRWARLCESVLWCLFSFLTDLCGCRTWIDFLDRFSTSVLDKDRKTNKIEITYARTGLSCSFHFL